MPFTVTLALVAVVLTAAWHDIRYRRIPNWINVLGLGSGIAFGCVSGWHGLELALLGTVVAVVVYLPLYMLRGMGAGDVKLMAAVGALAGPTTWVKIFLLTAVIGGVAAASLVVYRRKGRATFRNVAVIVDDLVHGRAPAKRSSEFDVRSSDALRLPHGVTIAAGSLLVTASQKFL